MLKQINYSGEKIYVVGGVFDKLPQIDNFLSTLDRESLCILNGNICYPYLQAEKNILYLQDLLNKYNIHYVAGGYDLVYQKKLYDNNQFNNNYYWLDTLPLACEVVFSNHSKYLICNGGVDVEKFKHKNTINNLNISLNQNNWHQDYYGELGYVVSNSPYVKGSQVNLYLYSCTLNASRYLETGNVAVQAISRQGLEEVIEI